MKVERLQMWAVRIGTSVEKFSQATVAILVQVGRGFL